MDEGGNVFNQTWGRGNKGNHVKPSWRSPINCRRQNIVDQRAIEPGTTALLSPTINAATVALLYVMLVIPLSHATEKTVPTSDHFVYKIVLVHFLNHAIIII